MLIPFLKVFSKRGQNEDILEFFTRRITLFKRGYKDFESWLEIEHNKGSIKGSELEVEITLIKESRYYKREES
jgi:hypothetical protein